STTGALTGPFAPGKQPMLIQLASLKVGSMRTGYTAAASFTTTASWGAHALRVSCSTPSSDTSQSNISPVNEALTGAAGAAALPTNSMREVNSLPVASVTRNRL